MHAATKSPCNHSSSTGQVLLQRGTPHCSAKRQARDADAERDYLGKTGAWDGERDTDGRG